jgi:ComEC/Rec2-related protein
VSKFDAYATKLSPVSSQQAWAGWLHSVDGESSARPLAYANELPWLLVLLAFVLAHVWVAYTPFWPPWLVLLVSLLLALSGLLGQILKAIKPKRIYLFTWLALLGLSLGFLHAESRWQAWLKPSRWVATQHWQPVEAIGHIELGAKGYLLRLTQGHLQETPAEAMPVSSLWKLEEAYKPFAFHKKGASPPQPSGAFKGLQAAQKVRVIGRLLAPQSAALPGGFNNWTYLSSQGILGSLQVSDAPEALRLLPSSAAEQNSGAVRWAKLTQAMEGLRLRVATVFKATLGEHLGSLLGGLVLGDRAVPLDENLKKAFTDTGLVHLLAASGMNVGVVAAAVLVLGRLLRLPGRVLLLLAMASVAFYAILTGLPPSIQRASAMLELALFLKFLDYRLPSLLLLAFAIVALLFWQPLSIYSVGLQLSILTTLGILGFLPFLTSLALPKPFAQHLHPRLKSLLNLLWGSLTVPMAAQVWATPLLATCFNQLPLHSLLLNSVAVLLVTPLTVLGFCCVPLVMLLPSQWSATLLWPFLMLGKPLLAGLLQLAVWGQQQRWALLSVPSPSFWSLCCLYAMLFFLVVAWHPKLRLSWRTQRLGLALGLLLALLPFPLTFFQPKAPAYSLAYWPLGGRFNNEASTTVALLLQGSPQEGAGLLVLGSPSFRDVKTISQTLTKQGIKQLSWVVWPKTPVAERLSALTAAHPVQHWLSLEKKKNAHSKNKPNKPPKTLVSAEVWHLKAGQRLQLGRQTFLTLPTRTTLQTHRRKRYYDQFSLQHGALTLAVGSPQSASVLPYHLGLFHGEGYPKVWYVRPGSLWQKQQHTKQAALTHLPQKAFYLQPKTSSLKVSFSLLPYLKEAPFHWLHP